MSVKLNTTFCLFFLLISPIISFSQKVEIGTGLGVFHYKGDITPRFRPFSVQGGGNFFFRYNANRAFSYKLGYVKGHISGKDSQSSDEFQRARNYEFKTKISEINTQIEYNFLNFRQGYSNLQKSYTPYIFGGLSYLKFQPNQQTSPYKTTQFIIPFGIGFKSTLKGAWNWGMEFGTRKTFTDNLDNLGKTSSIVKLEQGNSETYDKYYYTNISLSYTFYKVACPK